ncbi:hypothetical protein [Pseudonocardia sp. TRM90224]|uniref:hypothetical protein n=1 Tax=Pseudonocardia sp. TRM90224 TaxID=2812678 RepID=UPI001E40D3FE|nr:hypothetical protein [Pseudonocardia sp. TRM90224]
MVKLAIGLMVGAVALAGCGAGQVTQTSRQVAAVDGASGGAGSIAVRNAKIEFGEHAEGDSVYPRGGDAPLSMVLINAGTQDDELVSVSSPAASTVVISGNKLVPAGATIMVEGAPAPVVPAAPTGTAPTGTASARPSGVVAPTASPTATPPSGVPSSAEATAAASATAATGTTAPDAAAPATTGAPQIVLTGLRTDIAGGLTYEVVLTFRNAGEIRLPVPVATSEDPRVDEHGE